MHGGLPFLPHQRSPEDIEGIAESWRSEERKLPQRIQYAYQAIIPSLLANLKDRQGRLVIDVCLLKNRLGEIISLEESDRDIQNLRDVNRKLYRHFLIKAAVSHEIARLESLAAPPAAAAWASQVMAQIKNHPCVRAFSATEDGLFRILFNTIHSQCQGHAFEIGDFILVFRIGPWSVSVECLRTTSSSPNPIHPYWEFDGVCLGDSSREISDYIMQGNLRAALDLVHKITSDYKSGPVYMRAWKEVS